MELTGTVGRMSGGCRCCRYRHGKDVTEEQHSKNKAVHKHNKHEVNGVKKSRWNKKHGIQEKSRKHSRAISWLY